MASRPYRAGKRVRGRHGRSLTGSAWVVDAALALEAVKNVRVGSIKRAGRITRLVLYEDAIGVVAEVQTDHSKQKVFITTDNPSGVVKELRQRLRDFFAQVQVKEVRE